MLLRSLCAFAFEFFQLFRSSAGELNECMNKTEWKHFFLHSFAKQTHSKENSIFCVLCFQSEKEKKRNEMEKMLKNIKIYTLYIVSKGRKKIDEKEMKKNGKKCY